MEVLKTTGSRGLDEEIERILARLTTLEKPVPTVKTPSTPAPPVIPSLPPILPPIGGVTSIAVSGDPIIIGDVVLEAGTGILLGESGQNIVINGIFGTVTPTVVLPAASPYTVGGGDIVIFGNTTTGAITIQLVGGAINTGRFVWINNRGTGVNLLTVTTTSGSVLNITSLAAGAGALYVSDGTNWYSIQNSTGN